jgi:large subunit ribosomal protein L29
VKIQQIRDMDSAELARRETALQGELFNLRIQSVTLQPDNVKRIWAVRKDIARVKTVIRERQLRSDQER